MPDATYFTKELWLMLAPTFNDAIALDGFGQYSKKAQAYTGFIAAACGAMAADICSESSMTVLAALARQLDKMQADPTLTR